MTLLNFHTHKPTAEGAVTPRSFGIHPWHADEERSTTYSDFVSRYRAEMEAAEWIGECGLDKVRGGNYSHQLHLFGWQLRLAEEMHKPVVIHCVRAYNDLLTLRRRYNATPWVVHGFTGSLPLAAQLHQADIGVSFGAAILDLRRVKVRQTLARLPYPFLLETDDADSPIEAIYQAAAQLRGTDIDSLADTIKGYLLTLYSRNRTQQVQDRE